jgi:hypothetical protein
LGSEDSGDVGAVAGAVHGVVVGFGVVKAVVCVAYEISTEGDEAVFAEAASKGWMLVVDLYRC